MEEVFILEDALFFCLMVGVGVTALYFMAKFALSAAPAIINRVREMRQKSPEEKIQAAISRDEDKLESLEDRVRAMRGKHARLKAERDDEEHEAKKWAAVEAALRPAEEQDLKEATDKRLHAEMRMRSLTALLEAEDGMIKAIGLQVQEFRDKIAAAKDTRLSLEVRMAAADIRKELAEDDSAMSALEEMEDEALTKEGIAEAYEETNEFKRNVIGGETPAERKKEDDKTKER